MINMNDLLQLQQQDAITLAEALNSSQLVVEKYLPMLRNLMQIRTKAQTTDDEPLFRGAQVAQSSVPQLYEMLSKLEQAILTLEAALVHTAQHKPEELHQLEIQIGEKLIKMLTAAVKHCDTIYAQRSTSFAMILQDLLLLLEIVSSKLGVTGLEQMKRTSSDNVVIDNPEDVPDLILATDEKMVYVRIFHREMPNLGVKKDGLQWVKPLLDSVKFSEKHGFAVYEHEADVIKSIKGDTYGYVSLKIKTSQDISHQRPVKVDQALGCRLLTVANVDLDSMVKLTHQSVEYWIREGQLHKVK